MSKQPYDPMDMKALRCFEAMAKHGSLTKAGIELGISDAAVSQRIKALERYLEVKLYESRGGKVRLTQAGLRTKALATRLLDELARFAEENGDEEAKGTVTLGAASPLLRYHLPDIAESYAREYRYARLRLLSRRPAETVALVRQNEIDLGIVHKRQLPSDIRFHAWRTFKSFILIPRGHPLARQGAPTIEDILSVETLSQYSQIVSEIDSQDQNRIKEGLERLGLPYHVALEVGNIETVKHYVARGHGIAAVSGICLTPEDKSVFHIIPIPDALDGETTYGVILRKDKHISPSLGGLLALLDVPELSDGES